MKRKYRWPSYVMVVLGFLLVSLAAWTVSLTLGLLAAGLSMFALEWTVNRE